MNETRKGLLAVWTDIAPEAEAEFNEWYNREHVPERAGNEGFLNARRYAALEGEPRYFAAYDTESLAALGSPAYAKVLAHQTEWSQRMLGHFRNTTRMIAEQAADFCLGAATRVGTGAGNGPPIGMGGALLGMRMALAPEDVDGLRKALDREDFAALLEHPGIVRVCVALGTISPVGSDPLQAAEQAANAPDAAALLIEGVDADALRELEDAHLSAQALTALGLPPASHRGLYTFQYAVSG